MIRRWIWVAGAALSWVSWDGRADEATEGNAAAATQLLADQSASPEALHAAGELAAKERRFEQARELFQGAGDAGRTESLRRLAGLWLYGSGGPRDPAKARALFLQAAELGDVVAMEEFATMASRGWHGAQDAPAAIKWATRAVEADHHSATLLLGAIYEEGRGVPRDLAKALKWYDRGRAHGHRASSEAALRLRRAAERTSEQKLADFEAALVRAGEGTRATADRGAAYWRYHRSLYDAGLSPVEAAQAARPGLAKLVETDFHAVANALTRAPLELRPALEAELTADQRLVVRQIFDNMNNRARPGPEIAPGLGWSFVYSAEKRPAVAVTAAPAPSPVNTPVAAPRTVAASAAAVSAQTIDELSAATRSATNWQEFFTASARRGSPFFSRHEKDVALFQRRHPADAEQLRAAYRAAYAALQPTAGTIRGSEAGAQFVAYLLAVRGSKLAAADVIPWVRNDFLNLARGDTYNAHHALMGVPDPDLGPLRGLLSPAQNSEVGAIAAKMTRNEALPKVGDADAAAGRAVASYSPLYFFERGNRHYDARNNEAAIADYDVVIQAEPRNTNARFNRMLARYYARQHEAALADADFLLNNKMLQGEQLAQGLFMRGEILWWLERGTEADQAYADAIKLNPKLAERNRAASTREGALARMAASAARTNAIMNQMDAGIRRSTDQLRAANQASLNVNAANSAASAPSNDPVELADALYTRLVANLASPGQKGAALTGDQQAALAELARLMPLAARSANEAFNRGNAERNRNAPAAETFTAADTAWRENRPADTLRLLEQAASAGHPGAKANLANYFARPVGDLPALPVARRKQLLLEAHAAGNPMGSAGLVNLLLDQEPPDFAEAVKWARTSTEMGHLEGGYAFYFAVLQSRYALQRDPMRLIEASKPDNVRAQREELDQALAALRKSALRGQIYAKYELARYHYAGGLPGLRRGFSFDRPEHNLHLARFWFEQALKYDDDILSEQTREEIPRVVAAIDRALAAAKGREWTADEIIAALEAGLPSDNLAWLLSREGGTYSKSQHIRILTSEAFRKISEQSILRDQLAGMVLLGPSKEARALAAATIAERRRTVTPLPDLGTDVAELRRRFEAGDPAAAYALLELIPRQNQGGWPEGSPPAERVREVAVSRDYAPAQYLRIRMEKLDGSDLATRDLPRAFALALSSARAGSAEAARLVADYYREHRSESPVRPNLVEAEWWYAQSAALSRPDQYKGFAGLTDPERSLASLYQFETPGMGGGFSFAARHPAVHRWARELRARGGDFKTLTDEIVAYFGTSDAGGHDLDKFIAALPAALPPIAAAELARLEREAEAGQPEALRTLARALAQGEGGLRQDDVRAAALYRRAAEAGDRGAMSVWAEMLDKGYGVRADLIATREWRARAEGKPVDRAAILIAAAQSAARELRTHALVEPYLREAIQLGSAKAMTSLGFFQREGRVMPKDAAAGLRLIQQGAEAGDVSAMTSLAYLYRDQKEGIVDLAASHRWFVRAAEAGDKNAISVLVYDFEQGRNGAPRDAREALRWARLAASDNATIRTIVLPRLEKEVAAGADPGTAAFDRAATLTGDARLAALREAARQGNVEATAQLLDLLCQARSWHEAHWLATRPHMIERDDSAKARALIEGQADFKVAKLAKDGVFSATPVAFSAAFDEPLEKFPAHLGRGPATRRIGSPATDRPT